MYTRCVADKQWTVLVVDDCEKTAKLIKKELSGKGFEIHLATSVDQATRMILKEETRPDTSSRGWPRNAAPTGSSTKGPSWARKCLPNS